VRIGILIDKEFLARAEMVVLVEVLILLLFFLKCFSLSVLGDRLFCFSDEVDLCFVVHQGKSGVSLIYRDTPFSFTLLSVTTTLTSYILRPETHS
jgi:hypothetical protein